MMKTFPDMKLLKYAASTLGPAISIDINNLHSKFQCSKINTFWDIKCLKFDTPTFRPAHWKYGTYQCFVIVYRWDFLTCLYLC